MKLLLLHPPLDDPTLPYHSTAYLKGHLVANGFTDVTMRDINVEFVNYTFEPRIFAEFNEEADRRLHVLGSQAHLSYQKQEEYQSLCGKMRTDLASLERAVQGFRSPEAFLDYGQYVKNLNSIVRYYDLLGALSYPAENIGFLQRHRGRYSTFNLRDLLDGNLGTLVCFPFEKYFYERLATDRDFRDADLIGISIVYDHQLYHALHFARLIKRAWPEKKLILGGTSISQIYKHLKSKDLMKRFFELCDAIVIGEGETAICEIMAGGGCFDGSQTFMNTILYDKGRDQLILPRIRYESVPTLGTPVYDHPWELYLSPARGINYAPTRGCYWNRCTFCDYGLNTDKPTSPWRERKIDQCISDLKEAQAKYGVRYVYFAVDVMSPTYLERLSDAILESGLDIRWSAELRMEKIFSAERCRKMAKAGCTCVSFGMESGNQRILDLIDKGTNVAYMSQTMKNFASAGIACQLMAFTDFPTETPQEKKETFDFVSENDAYWSTGGLGTFLLTGTSMIAKNPSRFGITVVETQDCDVSRAVSYRIDSETGQRTALAEDADASFDDSGGIFPPVLGRPWAGGTDTLHSMIYYEHYGRKFFKNHPLDQLEETRLEGLNDPGSLQVVVNGTLIETHYNLNTVVENRQKFLEYLRQRVEIPAEPTYLSFSDWAAGIENLPRAAEPDYWLISGKQCLKIEKLTYRIFSATTKSNFTVDQILEIIPASLRAKFQTYLMELEAKGMIYFARDGKMAKQFYKANESIVVRPNGNGTAFGKLAPKTVALAG
jgi:anaerobic magnesium-protoporphyrin IX monomethyl ester cyclase